MLLKVALNTITLVLLNYWLHYWSYWPLSHIKLLNWWLKSS